MNDRFTNIKHMLDHAEHNDDILHSIYNIQYEFQRSLGYELNILRIDDEVQVEYLKNMLLAIMSEVNEVAQEIPWKPWKINMGLNKEKIHEELIDVLHFFLNICIAVGLTPLEIYRIYRRKMSENIARQERGY